MILEIEADDLRVCGAEESYLDELIGDDTGGRMFACSDTDYCEERREARHRGAQLAEGAA